MSKNKLYTLSYFRKRLNDKTISSVRLINKYNDNDVRYWTILIDPGKKNIICTCFKNGPDDYYFSLLTDRYTNFEVKTKSMDIIIDSLLNLINIESNNIDEREQGTVK